MRHRFRAVAALFTLMALTASFAEGVWASVCGNMGSSDAQAAAVAGGSLGGAVPMDAMDMPAMVSAGMDDMAMTMTSSMAVSPPTVRGTLNSEVRAGQEQGPDRTCPVTAVLGSCSALSLPAHEAIISFAPVLWMSTARVPVVTPDLLLATGILRPPRA